jgi:hypothetical protein
MGHDEKVEYAPVRIDKVNRKCSADSYPEISDKATREIVFKCARIKRLLQ